MGRTGDGGMNKQNKRPSFISSLTKGDFSAGGVKAMQRRWGRKVSDLAYSEFVSILKQKAKVVEIDRFYPSSKTCSKCDYINTSLSLKDREWTCPICGTKHDRDLNAAVNIAMVGSSTIGTGDVRPCI